MTRSPIGEFSNLLNPICQIGLNCRSYLEPITHTSQLSLDVTSKRPVSLSSSFCCSSILLQQLCCSQSSSRWGAGGGWWVGVTLDLGGRYLAAPWNMRRFHQNTQARQGTKNAKSSGAAEMIPYYTLRPIFISFLDSIRFLFYVSINIPSGKNHKRQRHNDLI